MRAATRSAALRSPVPEPALLAFRPARPLLLTPQPISPRIRSRKGAPVRLGLFRPTHRRPESRQAMRTVPGTPQALAIPDRHRPLATLIPTTVAALRNTSTGASEFNGRLPTRSLPR